MLAQSEERDRALDDLGDLAICATVTLGRESREQLRIPLVPHRRVEQRPQEPARRRARAWRVEVEAEGAEDLGKVALVAEPVVLRDDAWLVGHPLVIKVAVQVLDSSVSVGLAMATIGVRGGVRAVDRHRSPPSVRPNRPTRLSSRRKRRWLTSLIVHGCAPTDIPLMNAVRLAASSGSRPLETSWRYVDRAG